MFHHLILERSEEEEEDLLEDFFFLSFNLSFKDLTVFEALNSQRSSNSNVDCE